jgi:transposase InsO family protein
VRSTTFSDPAYAFRVADGYDLTVGDDLNTAEVRDVTLLVRVRNDDDQARAIVLDVENPYDDLILVLQVGQPDIFNTDQGVQFTAHTFTDELETAHVRISMDGRGRAFDNIFVERLWRTVKYEDLYLKGYATVAALASGLEEYFQFYNDQRPHQSLDYRVPADAYFAVNVPDPGVTDPP